MVPMKFIVEGLTPELIRRAEKELGENEKTKAQGLKELRKRIEEEPDFYPCDEDFFLLRFLRAKKYRVDKAFTTLKNFYSYKARYSGILSDFEVCEISDVLEQDQVTNFEFRDSKNGGIGYIRLGSYDIDKTSPDALIACILILGEFAMNIEATQVCGYSVIIDFAGFNLRMMKHYASPTFLYRMITMIQDVVPCRINGFHVVNEPFYFSILLNIAKTIISEKLKKRLYVHGSNMKHLHKHFSPEILPEELAGKQGPIKQFLKSYKENIYAMSDHIKKLNKYGYQGETLEQLTKGNDKARLT